MEVWGWGKGGYPSCRDSQPPRLWSLFLTKTKSYFIQTCCLTLRYKKHKSYNSYKGTNKETILKLSPSRGQSLRKLEEPGSEVSHGLLLNITLSKILSVLQSATFTRLVTVQAWRGGKGGYQSCQNSQPPRWWSCRPGFLPTRKSAHMRKYMLAEN